MKKCFLVTDNSYILTNILTISLVDTQLSSWGFETASEILSRKHSIFPSYTEVFALELRENLKKCFHVVMLGSWTNVCREYVIKISSPSKVKCCTWYLLNNQSSSKRFCYKHRENVLKSLQLYPVNHWRRVIVLKMFICDILFMTLYLL